MDQMFARCIKITSGLIVALSLFAFLVNHLFYDYPGNNYFPDNVILLAILLGLFSLGIRICFTKESSLYRISWELLYLFGVMAIIALATDAVQLTPFPPIDRTILNLEAKIHVDMSAIVRWINNYPELKRLLNFIYDSLAYQMSVIPLVVIFTCRFHLLREYYFYLVCTTLLGFSFYYFFPTTAPASVLDPSLFSIDQIATGLKFQQIHQHTLPTTNAGGLIALPSFHAIWAILCVNLLKEWRILWGILAVINTFLIASCVLLGWHYCIDIIGSIIILLISYWLKNSCCSKESLNF